MTKLAYQLYCSREFPPLEHTARMLAEHGISEVEGFGGSYEDVEQTAAVLAAHELTMPSGHFDLGLLERDLAGCVAIATRLGMVSIYAPYIMPAERPADAAGWQAYADRLARVGEEVRAAGFGFGWHNHDFEFTRLADGQVPLDIILGADAKLEWEADLAWVAVGNADPLAYLAKYQERITSIHIKDIAPAGECADEDGWADIGSGTLDWPALLAATAASPLRHRVLEHDKPKDDARFVARSVAFLREKGQL